MNAMLRAIAVAGAVGVALAFAQAADNNLMPRTEKAIAEALAVVNSIDDAATAEKAASSISSAIDDLSAIAVDMAVVPTPELRKIYDAIKVPAEEVLFQIRRLNKLDSLNKNQRLRLGSLRTAVELVRRQAGGMPPFN